MSLVGDIAAIYADGTKTDDQKRLAVYSLKGTALIDVIMNGKPAPSPIPPLINRTFTLDGKTVRINAATLLPNQSLMISITLNGTVNHTNIITNPPILPRVTTGNEKQDLIQAVSEMLADLPVS
jgi:hypothetical protein